MSIIKEFILFSRCINSADSINQTLHYTLFKQELNYITFKKGWEVFFVLLCQKLALFEEFWRFLKILLFAGVFFGAVFLGGLADKVGRKLVYCWSAVLQLILGVGVAFIPEYYTFLVVRFLYGIFGSAGSYITGFVLTMETVGPSYRSVCGIAFQAVFAGGFMLVAAWGAVIKQRFWLQVSSDNSWKNCAKLFNLMRSL